MSNKKSVPTMVQKQEGPKYKQDELVSIVDKHPFLDMLRQVIEESIKTSTITVKNLVRIAGDNKVNVNLEKYHVVSFDQLKALTKLGLNDINVFYIELAQDKKDMTKFIIKADATKALAKFEGQHK